MAPPEGDQMGDCFAVAVKFSQAPYL